MEPGPYDIHEEDFKVDLETSKQILSDLFGKTWEEEDAPGKRRPPRQNPLVRQLKPLWQQQGCRAIHHRQSDKQTNLAMP